MSNRSDHIEALARMAARLAGRDPDEHLTMALGDVVPFDGPMWSYPDFLARAEAAYHALTAPSLIQPDSMNGQVHPASGGSDRQDRPTP
jgi:hypothetical protein